jgi:hypothetical protein
MTGVDPDIRAFEMLAMFPIKIRGISSLISKGWFSARQSQRSNIPPHAIDERIQVIGIYFKPHLDARALEGIATALNVGCAVREYKEVGTRVSKDCI